LGGEGGRGRGRGYRVRDGVGRMRGAPSFGFLIFLVPGCRWLYPGVRKPETEAQNHLQEGQNRPQNESLTTIRSLYDFLCFQRVRPDFGHFRCPTTLRGTVTAFDRKQGTGLSPLVSFHWVKATLSRQFPLPARSRAGVGNPRTQTQGATPDSSPGRSAGRGRDGRGIPASGACVPPPTGLLVIR
jgi:hypothetical protein